jgi:hypothetical protein
MTESLPPGLPQDPAEAERFVSPENPISRPEREIRYRHSENFEPLLRSLGSSLLKSTYSAGKVAVVGTSEAGLELNFLNLEKAMGVAIGQDRIAVDAFSCLCTLDPECSFVPRWKPAFISELRLGDRYHFNGLALENGRSH